MWILIFLDNVGTKKKDTENIFLVIYDIIILVPFQGLKFEEWIRDVHWIIFNIVFSNNIIHFLIVYIHMLYMYLF